MILCASIQSVHAAFIHFPCCPWWCMLNESLAQAMFILVISISLASHHCCLFFTHFSSAHRTEHVPNLCSIEKCLKFPFQQVVIHPKLISNERVMSVLLWRSILPRADFRTRNSQWFHHNSLLRSSKIAILDLLERRLHGASEYSIFLYCTSLNMCTKSITTATLVLKFQRCWCSSLQLFGLDFSSSMGTIMSSFVDVLEIPCSMPLNLIIDAWWEHRPSFSIPPSSPFP